MTAVRARRAKGGFSLIEISIVLAVISLVLAGLIPFVIESMNTDKVKVTMDRLEAIDKALIAYSVTHGRLPCPGAATSHPLDATYGVVTGASDTDGDCRDGPINADWQADGVAFGAVPVRALDLADEYGLDGWNRKFSYMISDSSLIGLATGSIQVRDISGGVRTNNAVYALISHGPNGHGAYLLPATAGRYNAQISSAAGDTYAQAELENCSCTATGGPAAGNRTLVMSMKVGSGNNQFDDIVRYKTLPQLVPEENGLLPLTSDIEVTVHQTNTAADYPSINAAVNDLKTTYYPAGGMANILLLSGFIMDEALIVDHGQNLGWMRISSEDTTVVINRASLSYSAFRAMKRSTLPEINTLFSMNETGVADRIGIRLDWDSHVYVLADKGIINAGSHGLFVTNGSTASIHHANFSGAGGTGVYAINNASVSANGAHANNAAVDGFYADNASTIEVSSGTALNAGRYAFLAQGASSISAPSADGRNSGSYCVMATEGSTITANNIDCRNGGAAFVAQSASTIHAANANAQGAYAGAWAYNGSRINVSSANLSHTTGTCVYAGSASTVSANSTSCLGSDTVTFAADDASVIDAKFANSFGDIYWDVTARDGSTINAESIKGGNYLVSNGSFINIQTHVGDGHCNVAINSVGPEGTCFE